VQIVIKVIEKLLFLRAISKEIIVKGESRFTLIVLISFDRSKGRPLRVAAAPQCPCEAA